MGTLTIRLDEKLERELARLAKRTGRSKSEVAREAQNSLPMRSARNQDRKLGLVQHCACDPSEDPLA